jgi:DNA repair exonuclease SbcCD ATPase subunit
VCFVISPIGSPESATRERADHVFEYVIEEALQGFDYTAKRADHIAEPGIITNDVIEYIVESPLVIADLTDSNANVFYELAIRHAYEKPTIQIIEEGEEIPFDLASTRTIVFDHSDVESVSAAKDAIIEQVENIDNESESFENPITVAEDIRDLKESENPEERSMAELIENISDLRSDVRSIKSVLSSPEEVLPPEYIDTLFSDSEYYSEDITQRMEEIRDKSEEIISVTSDKDDAPYSLETAGQLANEQHELIEKLLNRLDARNKDKDDFPEDNLFG